MAAALADPGLAAGTAALFRGPRDRVPERLAIYRGNVLGNCTNALENAYPIVSKIVGEAFFEELTRAFVHATASTSANLNLYGAKFADFLAKFPAVADLPYLGDVARMEWQAHLAYYAADGARFDFLSLARKSPAECTELRPRLAPHCSLLESRWPLARLWTVHQDDYVGALEVDLDGEPHYVLVYRDGWRPQVLLLAPGDYAFLRKAIDGEDLGAALEAALAADSDFAPTPALGRWIDAQIIVSLE